MKWWQSGKKLTYKQNLGMHNDDEYIIQFIGIDLYYIKIFVTYTLFKVIHFLPFSVSHVCTILYVVECLLFNYCTL